MDFVVGGLVILIVVLVLALSAPWLDPNQYSALASAIQTMVVVLALFVAVQTLRWDSSNKRIDRVHELHRELTTGEVGAARARLGAFLRANGTERDPVRITSLGEMREGTYSTYTNEEASAKPRRDATLILRFFERARIAQAGNAVDDALFAALIGRHAAWWDCAIAGAEATSRRPLGALADWANEYAERHPEVSGLDDWGTSRQKDFPSLFGRGSSTGS